MGEYADLELDRIIEGFERRAEQKVAKSRKGQKSCQCEWCGKKFWTSQGVADQVRDVHSEK